MSSDVCQLPSGVGFERSSALISRLLSSSTLLKYPFLVSVVVPKPGLSRSRTVPVLALTTQRPLCPRRDLRGSGRALLSFQREGRGLADFRVGDDERCLLDECCFARASMMVNSCVLVINMDCLSSL